MYNFRSLSNKFPTFFWSLIIGLPFGQSPAQIRQPPFFDWKKTKWGTDQVPRPPTPAFTYVQKCMQWRKWRNWRKIASRWRFELDAKSGPLEAGNFGENGDFGEIPCMQWRNWRKITSLWRFELDAKSGPLEAVRPRAVHGLVGILEKLGDNTMKLLEINGRNVKDVPNSERSNFCSIAQRVNGLGLQLGFTKN